MSNGPLVNKIAQSGLITIKLEEYVPKLEVVEMDIKDYLFKELILKEKDFREAMKAYDWKALTGKVLCLYCSTDAIIPLWAWMLVAAEATPFAEEVFHGTREAFLEKKWRGIIENMQVEDWKDQRLIIKGCSDHPIPVTAYVALTARLRPLAKSIMFGEACSTVPVYKKSNPALRRK